MSSPSSPLLGSWPSTAGVNPGPAPIPNPPAAPGSPSNPWGNPAGLPNPGSNIKDAWRNQALLQTQQSQMRNQLIPQWAQLMQSLGGQAGNFFKMLTDLGSPFYQKKQQQTFEQGAKAGQDAAATARQQVAASGTGYTPSGTAAALFGGMGQAEAGNQEEAFLNNLFQNEQLQLAGASGLAQLAGLFNPSGLFGGAQGQSTQGPTAASQFADVIKGITSLFPNIGSGAIPSAGG